MSTLTISLDQGAQVQIRSDASGSYYDATAKDVKVDQTVKLRLDGAACVRLYSVISKIVGHNNNVVLSVRYLPPFRKETPMLAFVARARKHLQNDGCGVSSNFGSDIKLMRAEMGVNHVHATASCEEAKNAIRCSCCGGLINRAELAIKVAMRPMSKKHNFKMGDSKRKRRHHRYFHFHNCTTPDQEYKILCHNEKLSHIDLDQLRRDNEKAYTKARDFQVPWVILSACRTNFMFAYDSRGIIPTAARMAELGTPAKFLCRVTRHSLNMEHPISADQFDFLVTHDLDVDHHKALGHNYVTCSERVDDHAPVYEYANTIEEIRNICLHMRKSADISCYGFLKLCD